MWRPLPLALLLAACGSAPQAPRETEPAVAEALADPIMADPQLVLQQEGGASMSVPLGAMPPIPADAPTLGTLVKAARAEPPFAKCTAPIAYSYQWMARLPTALAPPKNAMAVEAAGQDSPACALRIVRYGSKQTPADIIAHYAEQARKAGYVVSETDKSLAGTRGPAVFRLMVSAVDGGSAFDLILNHGG